MTCCVTSDPLFLSLGLLPCPLSEGTGEEISKCPQVDEDQKADIQSGVEGHTCRISVQELMQDRLELKANLNYIVGSDLKKEKRGEEGERTE